jgi:hypothetical protein
MPRAVTRAIEVGAGAKRDDQRAETVVRRGVLVNRSASLHRGVVYSLRAGTRAHNTG